MAKAILEPDSTITKEARERASRVSPEDLQREILAQLYVHNHFMVLQTNKLKNLDNYLFLIIFITVISAVLSFFFR